VVSRDSTAVATVATSTTSSHSPSTEPRPSTAAQRATIANMIVETGATGAVFPADERVREWLASQRREQDWTAASADDGASGSRVSVADAGVAGAAGSSCAARAASRRKICRWYASSKPATAAALTAESKSLVLEAVQRVLG